MNKKIAILGSTGSIGKQSLSVCDQMGFEVTAVTANTDFLLLEEQIRKYKPAYAALSDEISAKELKERVRDTNTKILSGPDGVAQCAYEAQADLCIDAIVGLAGLRPALMAIESKKNLAIANKEALVAGGDILLNSVKENGVKLFPVDSEHSAIFQCLQCKPENSGLKKIILTASGGPFFGKQRDQLREVTVADALHHPTWNMGAKITIDSATMFNKGLELIEAHYLFGVPSEKIDILVHRESIIHSMIEFEDNSVIAQLGVSDMRIPIQYALTYPNRYPSPAAELDLAEIASLTFYKPDYETFDCLNICKEAVDMGGLYPAAVNSANEEANLLFREGRISFLEMGTLIRTAFSVAEAKEPSTIENIFKIDRLARKKVLETAK